MTLSSKIRSSGLKPVTGKSSSGNSLMNMIWAQSMIPEKKGMENTAEQNQQQWAKSQLGEGTIPTKAVGGNITSESPQARFFTAEALNQRAKLEPLKESLRDVEAYAKTLPAGLVEGGIPFLQSKMTKGLMHSDITTYNDLRRTLARQTYRSLTNDPRISDIDAEEAALPLIWHPLEGPDVRDKKFGFIRYLVNQSEKAVNPEPENDIESKLRFQKIIKDSSDKYKNLSNENIMMLAPDGRQIPIHPKQVQNALKRGLKMPQGV